MNTFVWSGSRHAALLTCLVAVSGLLGSCTVDAEKTPALPDETAITSFEVTPVAAGKSPEEGMYLVEIGISFSETVVPPSTIQLLTRDAGGSSTRHTVADTGVRGDRSAGDRVWSAIIPADELPLNEDGAVSKTAGFKIECDIKIVGPGQECLSWGECPDESMLGGPTWFCICFDTCTVKWE